ncbi:HAD family hydrolase [Patescibacteria group bacterium]|nr:MAG: HAD family hydrolase [Patescibacteria group bacterium]
MIKAVILDLDDTTFMTEAACFDLENDVLTAMGRPAMSREVHLQTWGRPLFDAIRDRSPGIDVDEFRVAYDPLIKQYVANGMLDVVSPETLAAIDEIRTRLGKSVLALTSREELEVEHLLVSTHPLASRLEVVYHRDNMRYHKPDPRAFEHIEAEHGWTPDECVYVGDSIGDAESAKSAGLRFVASLESGLRTRHDFAPYAVDAFIVDIPGLIPVLEAMDKN